MSEGPLIHLETASAIADDVLYGLRQISDRTEVAGSVRRGQPEVSDIDICLIKKTGQRPVLQQELFTASTDMEPYDYTLQNIDEAMLEAECVIGRSRGEKRRQYIHTHSGVPVEIYMTDDPAKWGIMYAYRTGPYEFSRALALIGKKKNWHVHQHRLHQHPEEKKLGPNGWYSKPCKKKNCPLIIPTPEEEDYFDALDMNFVRPRDREHHPYTKAVRERLRTGSLKQPYGKGV